MNTAKAASTYWKRVCGTLNYDGVSEWHRASGCCRKFFWTIIMIGTVAPIVYYTYSLTTQYLQFPTATNLAEQQMPSIQFPNITICHTARFNRTYVKEHINVDMLRGVSGFPAYGTSDEMLNGFIQWLNFASFQPLNMTTTVATASEWIYQFYFNSTASAMAKYHLTSFVNDAALQCPQFLVKCIIGTKIFDCCANAQPIWTECATCYQIKPVGANGADLAHQNIPGNTGGLKVWAQVDKNIFPDGGLEEDVGLRVHVTAGRVTPSDNPVYIPPNKHALIRIDSTDMSFDPIIDKCTQNPPKLYGVPYSQGACSNECAQNISLIQCQCRTMGFGVRVTENEVCPPLLMAKCFLPLTTGFSASNEADLQFVTDQMNCVYNNCPKLCEQIVYDTYVSYQNVIPTNYTPYDYVSETAVPNQIDQYVFTAFFGDIKYTQVESAPLWDFNTFICNLGGLLGLWTGLSVITLVQAAVYCYMIPCCYEAGKDPSFLVPDLYEDAKRTRKWIR